ncbi:MAG: PAS domain S-box protein [Myxococcales bacterium]
MLTEFFLLRQLLLGEVLAHRKPAAPDEEARLVSWAVDQAIRESVTVFSEARLKHLHALERLSVGALESRTVDELLPRLLSAVLDAAPVDVVCVLLAEDGHLVHRHAVGLDAREHEAVRVDRGQGVVGRAARERRPVAAAIEADDSPEGLFLEARGIRALYAVPLVVEGGVIGVLQMGSRGAAGLSAQDQNLLQSLARRVAVAIEQHELRDRAEKLARDRDRLAKHLQVALDAAEMGWWSFDPGDQAFSLDQRAAALLGVGGCRVCHMEEVQAAFHPEDRPRAAACLAAALDPSRGTFSGEYRLLQADGSLRWVEDYGMGLFEEGRVVVVGAFADVTERKRTEEALRKTSEKLQRALSIETVGVLYFRLDGLVFGANAAFQRMSGYGLEELRATAHWEHLTAPEYREATFQSAARLAHTGRTPPYEKEMIRPDGSRWWGLFAPTRISGQGEQSECMEFIVDITAQKRAREEERARASFAQQLMGIVSHDLRSPLMAILMSSETALRRPDVDERLRTALQRIHSSGERAHRLIRDLLDFTQAQLRGGIPVQRQPVDLCAILQQVVDEVRQSHPDQVLRLAAPTRAVGEWDPDRVAQVAANLLSNAVQHGDRGAPVSVLLHDRGPSVELSITNWGDPIPADQLPRLFEPYRRVSREHSSSGGVGLGLFIVRQIVEAHGGAVDVHSDAEAGTTFRVVLPKGAESHRSPTAHPQA